MNPFVQGQAFKDLAWVAHLSHQTLSSLIEVRDWWTAREIDAAAMEYIRTEQIKEAFEREKRDREFWVRSFGGEVPQDGFDADEDMIARSSLGQH